MKVGILGAGQLGRMLAQAGEKLGAECRFLDPATEISAAGLGEHICAAYEDVEALEEFADGLDVITYEFENVPVESAHWLNQRVPVFPPPPVLRTAQDRLFEKKFLAECGIDVPRFADFFFLDEFRDAVKSVGLPAVIKTRRFGYDGKGQRVLRTQEEADEGFRDLQGIPLILEELIDFERELSILAVRGRDGEFLAYPLVENHHREGILRVSLAPAPGLPAGLQTKAEEHARAVMEKVGYVGVLAIEFFLRRDGTLCANEMAPRVHNSGHWSIEGAATSQFENHLRAVCGMPLGSTEVTSLCAMVNFIGEIPDCSSLGRAVPRSQVHDYGKRPRKNRKVGHVTVTGLPSGTTASEAENAVAAACGAGT